MISPKDKVHFCQLILKYKDQTITQEEMSVLDQLLLENPEYVEEVAHITEVYVQLQKFEGKLPFVLRDEILSDALWKALAADEKQAPVVQAPKDKPKRVIVQNVEEYKVTPPKKTLSKNSLISILFSAAAILFLILFARYAPPKGGYAVSTLTESVGAKWAERDMAVQVGQRLSAGSRFLLQEGLVELLFDSEARITLEAPADFVILGDNQIKLNYGRLFANVPRAAIGFSVETLNSKVIDLGTQFGVLGGIDGITEAHVYQGQIALFAGQKNQQFSVLVQEGYAKRVDEKDNVSVVELKNEFFVRKIESSGDLVWRGEDISLADIVSSGNGLGTGNSHVRLDYLKGFTTDQRGGETLIANDYLPIKGHPFIDGIFIPNGKTVVSSQGTVFDDFVVTSGVHCSDLYANPVPGSFFIDGQWQTIQFDGQEYSDRAKSCIVMPSSNHGITFDLDAIRNRYNLTIDQFTSRVGLVAFGNKRCNANFYVLVDGQLRYSLLGYTEKGVLSDISIKLEDTDRFLTLATSENVDQIDYMANSTLRENWCVFAEPVLVLEGVDGVRH